MKWWKVNCYFVFSSFTIAFALPSFLCSFFYYYFLLLVFWRFVVIWIFFSVSSSIGFFFTFATLVLKSALKVIRVKHSKSTVLSFIFHSKQIATININTWNTCFVSYHFELWWVAKRVLFLLCCCIGLGKVDVEIE